MPRRLGQGLSWGVLDLGPRISKPLGFGNEYTGEGGCARIRAQGSTTAQRGLKRLRRSFLDWECRTKSAFRFQNPRKPKLHASAVQLNRRRRIQDFGSALRV